jgi:flagellar hook-length control protein FliK
LGARWAGRGRLAGHLMGVGGLVVILVIGAQESRDRRFGDSPGSVASSTSDPAGSGSTGSADRHGGLAVGGQSTSRSPVVSRIPHVPDLATDVPWPNLGFSPVPLGMDLGWGAADAQPGSSVGASGAGRSSPTVPGLAIALVGAAALFGVVRAVVRRRQAQPGDAAADVTQPPSTDSTAEETGPPEGAEAAGSGVGAAPAAAAGSGDGAAPAAVAAIGAAAAAAAADSGGDSAGPAPTSPTSARPAATPAPTRRSAGRLTAGPGTPLVPAEARSRVQLYVKADWGPR